MYNVLVGRPVVTNYQFQMSQSTSAKISKYITYFKGVSLIKVAEKIKLS